MQIVELYSGTGGGHKTVAEAVKAGVGLALPTARVELVDGLKYLPWPFSKSDRIYLRVMKLGSGWNNVGFAAMNSSRAYRAAKMWGRVNLKNASELRKDTAGEMYVTCQPHFNPFMDAYAGQLGSRGYVHVVTDLYRVHSFHLAPGASKLMVPNTEVYDQAIKAGIEPERIKVTGIPINLKFKAQGGWIRNKLERIVVMAGGYGLNRIVGVCREVCAANTKCQVTVVCGHAQALVAELQALKLANLEVIGFTDQVYSLMNQADILITKAGGISLVEAFACGLPVILYAAIAGQEDGNRDYVLKNGVGVWCSRPDEIGGLVARWRDSPQTVREMSARSLALGRPEAAEEVGKEVQRLLKNDF